MSKVCGRCKNAVDDNATFCPYCGGRIYDGGNVVQQQSAQQQLVQQQSVQQQVVQQQPMQQQVTQQQPQFRQPQYQQQYTQSQQAQVLQGQVQYGQVYQGQVPQGQISQGQLQAGVANAQTSSNDTIMKIISLAICAIILFVPFMKLMTMDLFIVEENLSVWTFFQFLNELGGFGDIAEAQTLDDIANADLNSLGLVAMFILGMIFYLFAGIFIVKSVGTLLIGKKETDVWHGISSAAVMAVAVLILIGLLVFIMNYSEGESDYQILKLNILFYVIAFVSVVNCVVAYTKRQS